MEHRREIEGEEALVILSDFASLIPECPDCGSRACVEWIKYYIKWVINNMKNPEGPLGMLLALLNRVGSEGIEFSRHELKEVEKTKKVLVEKDIFTKRVRIRIVDASTLSDFQRETEEEWPTMLE